MDLNLPASVSSPVDNRYVFPAYWGGMVVTTQPPQIHQALRDLRRAVGSLAAKKQQGGPMFPVRSAKELMQKLAEGLDELNLHAFPIAQEVHHFDTSTIPGNQTQSGKPVFRTLAHVKSTVRVGAADGSYVDFVGSGHGGDVDDKSGGKADTYAWKAAILKGLCVPEQDMPDTDDDSSDNDSAGPTRSAKTVAAPTSRTTFSATEPVKAARDVKAARSDAGSTLDAAIAAINAAADANDEAKLEQIKNDVMSGAIALAGADRLKASTAFVRARNLINAKKAQKDEPVQS